MRALIVGVAGEACAFPLARLDRVLVVPASEVRTLGGRAYVEHDGERLGLVPAAELLGVPVVSAPAELAVVAVSDGEARYGIVVDRLVGEREIVVHTLDQRLGKLRNIAAASVLEDGEPLLIFDVDDLVRSADARFAEGTDATADSPGAGSGRRRALVVDDSVTVREMERRILEGRGWEVDVAVNGMDGWNRVRAGRYDVVVTDVDMPRMNGLQLTARIKGDPRLRRIPVLVVSYKERPEDRNRGLAAGADHYLSKSELREETLLAAVERVAGGA